VLFINDIIDIFNDGNCAYKLFADDVKMYATLDVNDDGKGLFDKFKSVEKWCSEWQLSISVKKCAVIHIHSGNTRQVTGPSFDIGGYALPIVDHVKDLGVLIDDCLKFHLHVNHIVSSAFTRANLILKCFNSRNVKVLLRAFKVYVLRIIEYASSVWSPHLVTDIRKTESVQRKFTKRFPGCSHLSYPDRLVRLNLDSLVVRRLRHDLILTYKIVFALTDMNPEDFHIRQQ